MIRVRWMISGRCVSLAPGAMTLTTCGANTMPSSAIPPVITRSVPRTRRASRNARSSPSRVSSLANVGTNAEASAPSAKKSRSRFGIRKARKNALASPAAPSSAANTISRTRPPTREPAVASDTRPAVRATLSGFSCRTAPSLPGLRDQALEASRPGLLADATVERSPVRLYDGCQSADPHVGPGMRLPRLLPAAFGGLHVGADRRGVVAGVVEDQRPLAIRVELVDAAVAVLGELLQRSPTESPKSLLMPLRKEL